MLTPLGKQTTGGVSVSFWRSWWPLITQNKDSALDQGPKYFTPSHQHAVVDCNGCLRNYGIWRVLVLAFLRFTFSVQPARLYRLQGHQDGDFPKRTFFLVSRRVMVRVFHQCPGICSRIWWPAIWNYPGAGLLFIGRGLPPQCGTGCSQSGYCSMKLGWCLYPQACLASLVYLMSSSPFLSL